MNARGAGWHWLHQGMGFQIWWEEEERGGARTCKICGKKEVKWDYIKAHIERNHPDGIFFMQPLWNDERLQVMYMDNL